MSCVNCKLVRQGERRAATLTLTEQAYNSSLLILIPFMRFGIILLLIAFGTTLGAPFCSITANY